MDGEAWDWRAEVTPEDVAAIRELAAVAGVFSPAEVAIAAELVTERLARGDSSGYRFVVAERAGRLAGYACWGPIDGTAGRTDLYWIVVHPQAQRQGLGGAVLERTLAAAGAAGSVLMFVDTSTRADYAPARAFYRRHGFTLAAEVADFFADGDGKAIFARRLTAAGAA